MRSQNLCHGKEGRGHEKAARYYFSILVDDNASFRSEVKKPRNNKGSFFPECRLSMKMKDHEKKIEQNKSERK